jgi:hypothetical protein
VVISSKYFVILDLFLLLGASGLQIYELYFKFLALNFASEGWKPSLDFDRLHQK